MAGLQEWLARRMGVSSDAAAQAVAEAVGRSSRPAAYSALLALEDRALALRSALQAHAAARPPAGSPADEVQRWAAVGDSLRAQSGIVESELARWAKLDPSQRAAVFGDPSQAIPESIRSAVQTAGAPTKGAGPAIPVAAGWDRSSRVKNLPPAGGIKAAIERARAAREGRVPFRQLANEIRAAIEAATPVRVEGPPGILETSQFSAPASPAVQELLRHPDAQNALLTIAADLGMPVRRDSDLARDVMRRIAEETQAAARQAARRGADDSALSARDADGQARRPRMGSTGQIAASEPANAELGVDASGQRVGVYAGPEQLEPAEVTQLYVARVPAIDPVTGLPKMAYSPGWPEPTPTGEAIARSGAGTAESPAITPEIERQVLENGMNYAGLQIGEDVGIFAQRTFKDADGNIVSEPDFTKPVHQLVKRRTGGDGNRSPEAVEFLLPLPDGTFQRLTPGEPGRPEVLSQDEVQRLIYQGFEPQGKELDWLRPQVEAPEVIGRRILEAAMSGGTTGRRTARAILDQYETLRRIGGQEAADAVLAEAGGPDIGQERLQALAQLAQSPATAAERQTAPLLDAIRVNRDIAQPSTARANAGLPEMSRRATSPQGAAYDFQAEGGGSPGTLEITTPPRAVPGASGVSVVDGLRTAGPATASGVTDAAPPSGQAFDATGRESEILAGAVDSLAPPADSPVSAVWKNQDFDQPVEVTGIAGEFNGETYYNIAGSATAIPGSQLDFAAGGAAQFRSVPYDSEARYDIFGDIGVRRPATGSNALAAFVVSPDSWASTARPAAASLAEMLQQTRRVAGARGIEDLPRGFRRSFDNSDPSFGTVEDVAAMPLRVRAARSAQDLRAALEELRAARGPGLGELQARLAQLRATDAQVQEQLAPLYERLQELRAQQARGDGFTTEPPGTSEEIARIQAQIDSAESAYRPALDEATRLVRERTEGPAAERFRQLDAQIVDLERQYGLQASVEGDAGDAAALQAAGDAAAREADPLSSPATLRPGRRKSAGTGLEDEAATRDVIDDARDTADPARGWLSAPALRQLFRKAFPGSKNYPLGLQAAEMRNRDMREPSESEVESFNRAAEKEAALRETLNAGVPDEQRNELLRQISEAAKERRAAMRRLSPDFNAPIEGSASAQDRMMQVLLGGGTDRARAGGGGSAAEAYDGDGGFDLAAAVEGRLDGAPAGRSQTRPQTQALSADAALAELLGGEYGDARSVLDNIVRAAREAGVPLSQEQVIYSMLRNYSGSSELGGGGFSDAALRDLAAAGWQNVQRMSPAAPQPSAVVGEYTTAQKALRGPARLRELIGNFLRPGDIARGAPQPDVAPQDQAWAMLPDPESISPDSAPGAAMPPEMARQAQSQLAAAEQRIAALEQQGLDTTALRDRAQSVRNAIALRLQGELKPAPRGPSGLSQAPGTDLGEGVDAATLDANERVKFEDGVTPEEAAAAEQAVAAKAQELGVPANRVTAELRERAAAEEQAAKNPPAPQQPIARFLEDTLRMGGYSSAAGRAYVVDAETASRLRAMEAENRGDIVASNRDEAARELTGDKDKQIDTSNPVIFGVNRKGADLHEIVAARESGSEPVLETLLARPHDPNAPAPQGMEVVWFNDEGVPTFVRNEGTGVRVTDSRGRDTDFDAPRADQIDLRPEAVEARQQQRVAAEPRGLADQGGRPVPAVPVPEAARRARELQAAALEAEEIRAEGRAAQSRPAADEPDPVTAEAEGRSVAQPEVRTEGLAPPTRAADQTAAGRTGEAPAPGRRPLLGRATKTALGAVAGAYALNQAQEAGYLPSNRDIVMAALGPQMLAIPGYGGDVALQEDTKQEAEPVVERIRRARRTPFLTSTNFLPY